ncbi:uncharacterized protein LOC115301405 isoform X1 [Suricata suricatta]|uniref:uncharacterized protein LOC115301405 isoform X1 n=1 Tax=Suricata suricatta TaxID=37032 RepID=UPI0011556F41|nr:uncharacterized protein LOC115301405 isoform X1 [Suricata suricatta]
MRSSLSFGEEVGAPSPSYFSAFFFRWRKRGLHVCRPPPSTRELLTVLSQQEKSEPSLTLLERKPAFVPGLFEEDFADLSCPEPNRAPSQKPVPPHLFSTFMNSRTSVWTRSFRWILSSSSHIPASGSEDLFPTHFIVLWAAAVGWRSRLLSVRPAQSPRMRRRHRVGIRGHFYHSCSLISGQDWSPDQVNYKEGGGAWCI